jgi:hypothetical protein
LSSLSQRQKKLALEHMLLKRRKMLACRVLDRVAKPKAHAGGFSRNS